MPDARSDRGPRSRPCPTGSRPQTPATRKSPYSRGGRPLPPTSTGTFAPPNEGKVRRAFRFTVIATWPAARPVLPGADQPSVPRRSADSRSSAVARHVRSATLDHTSLTNNFTTPVWLGARRQHRQDRPADRSRPIEGDGRRSRPRCLQDADAARHRPHIAVMHDRSLPTLAEVIESTIRAASRTLDLITGCGPCTSRLKSGPISQCF
jgi:hypothetical protein